jgi:DNA-binding NtrC family response regulator
VLPIGITEKERNTPVSRILIVDDEASICWAFRESLADEGHLVDVAASAEEGLEIAGAQAPDAVVLDVRLPGIDGLTAMRAFRDRIGAAPIIVITAFGNLETAVKAMEGGAFDYLVKPFDLDQATAVVKRALDRVMSRETRSCAPIGGTEGEALIGSSSEMQELFKSIALVAPTDAPVLITGESGTGKELVARAIHRHSVRRSGPFLPICLAALSPSLVERELFGHLRGSFTGAVQDRKGLLELANGGTVLLDEVGDIPASLQVKLLRAIEHREVTPVGDARPRSTDIRVVAATNRPLKELMSTGQFREDLFFRLSVFQIHIPPLRERREDIPALAEHFLRQSRLSMIAEAALSTEVLDELRSRPWTGNIRELRNSMEHAAILARGGAIRPEHLPAAAVDSAGVPASIDQEIQARLAEWTRQEMQQRRSQPTETLLYERFLELTEPPILQAALKACLKNRAAAAQMLGMHRATLRQKLRKYGIE